MKKVAELIRDPIWQGAAAIVAIIVSLVSLVNFSEKCEEPIYELVTDSSLCGTTSEEYIITPATTKTCRHKDFGRVSWASTEVVDHSSGWVGGSISNNIWCNLVQRNFIQSRSITGEYLIEVQDDDEEDAKWTLDRKRLYKYSCKVKFNWHPVYKANQNNLCGTVPAKVGYRDIAKQCQIRIGTKACDA